jgi:hypothetical protein
VSVRFRPFILHMKKRRVFVSGSAIRVPRASVRNDLELVSSIAVISGVSGVVVIAGA